MMNSGRFAASDLLASTAVRSFSVPLFPNDDAKERIRQAVDITDLVGSYLELRRQGRNYVALCPWHDDSKPSLQINPERQSWKCWVCNIGGDIFSFVMQREGVGFREALEMLAERAGIELKSLPQIKTMPGSADDKQTLYKALEWAAEQYHECLLRSDEGALARTYLEERGITKESVLKWRIGYAPDDWQWLVNRMPKQFTPTILQAVDVIGKSPNSGKLYDRFRGRMMFPIRDVALHTIAMGGRILPAIAAKEEQSGRDKPAKYLNSAETKVFSKSEHLYGLDNGRNAIQRTREIVVTEGYTDVILAHQGGVENATAVLGTALTERHIPLIRRFADTLYLVLDGDDAGQRRTNEIIQLFVFAPLDLRILTLPDDLDPADFVLQRGGDAFKSLLPLAVDGMDHKIEVETREIDVIHDTFRANKALENILSVVARAPRYAYATPEFIRLREQQIIGRLARQFQLPDADLRNRLNELRKTVRPANHGATAPAETANYRAAELDRCECELIEILTQHPDLAEKASMEIGVEEVRSLPARAIYTTYSRMAADGDLPSFGRVMAAIDDPAIKSLLVELDERASAKASHATEDGFSQLASIIRALRDRQDQTQRRAHLAALEDRRKDEAEQLNVLQQLMAAKRQRQGISESTDG
jgi:DNA primase